MDMVIVIIILGIVGMAVIPQLQGMIQEARLNEATAELVSGMQYAGNLAVRYRRPFGFQTDAAGQWFKIYDNRYYTESTVCTDSVLDDPPMNSACVVLHPLDKNWYIRNFAEMENYRLVSFSSAQIIFYPDGHSAAANTTVPVSLDGRQKTITVDGTTGRISTN